MKVHPNLKELLVDFSKKIAESSRNRDKRLTEWFVDDYLSTNSLSECERQPVGNNEQGGNKCNHACGSSITSDGTYCQDCGENTEV